MELNRNFLILGAVVCGIGVWLIFRPPFPAAQGADATVNPQGQAQGQGQGETAESSGGDRDSQSNADPAVAGSDGSDRGVPTGEELDGLTLQTIPPAPDTVENTSCSSDYGGLGVELRAWGDVLLPYTPGYPTSEPGQIWDCTSDTAFGGAIAMTHAAYLEALRPEVITRIAADTPGRQARIRDHPGGNELASLGFLCSPVGWNWDNVDTWSLLHSCGEGDLRLSFYQMEFRSERWWLVYPDSGRIETVLPPDDYEYYAFLGED